jgi:uncharacterized membrane protein YjfL (UPF0719 family)
MARILEGAMGSEITSTLFQMCRSLGWALVAAVSFAFSMGIAIKVFDWLSKDINEWDEIKKGNLGVALIFVAMVLSVGLVLYKVI